MKLLLKEDPASYGIEKVSFKVFLSNNDAEYIQDNEFFGKSNLAYHGSF